jgi:hypothetical protein
VIGALGDGYADNSTSSRQPDGAIKQPSSGIARAGRELGGKDRLALGADGPRTLSKSQ